MTEQITPEEIPASLSTLILSLTATALAYLGNPITPESEKTEPNLPLARHAIDTIEILKQKTEGNRTKEETELIEEVLTQLRLIYLQKAKSPST
ncbi:MAG: DUF1844 domain-containing protein [candidate division WOR-3 bacterium]